MKKREQIQSKINSNLEKIASLNSEVFELRKQALLLSDDVQWFEEKKETIGRGKTKREVLIGRIHWNEDFKDEDSGEIITIERQQTVRIDGEWL